MTEEGSCKRARIDHGDDDPVQEKNQLIVEQAKQTQIPALNLEERICIYKMLVHLNGCVKARRGVKLFERLWDLALWIGDLEAVQYSYRAKQRHFVKPRRIESGQSDVKLQISQLNLDVRLHIYTMLETTNEYTDLRLFAGNIYYKRTHPLERVWLVAAYIGDLELLMHLLHVTGKESFDFLPKYKDIALFDYSLLRRDKCLAQWLRKISYPMTVYECQHVMMLASEIGDLDLLKYCSEQGYRLMLPVFEAAIGKGNMKIWKWLCQQKKMTKAASEFMKKARVFLKIKIGQD